MVWAAVTETERSPLLFVTYGVKLNSQHYIANILQGCLLPWAKKHVQGVPWSLQPLALPKSPSPGFRGNPLIHKKGSLACKEP